jgi:hypothetical protein
MNVQRRLPQSHPLVTHLVTQALEHTDDRDCPANGVSGPTRWPRVSGGRCRDDDAGRCAEEEVGALPEETAAKELVRLAREKGLP